MDASCLMLPRRKAAQTFRDLLVWQKAHQFVLGVYQLTTAFPRQETFGLSLQMRRAAVSKLPTSWKASPSGVRRRKHAS